MLLKLLSVDSFVVAHSLVWVMNLPTMLRLRVLNKAFYDFVMIEPFLWYRCKVELWSDRGVRMLLGVAEKLNKKCKPRGKHSIWNSRSGEQSVACHAWCKWSWRWRCRQIVEDIGSRALKFRRDFHSGLDNPCIIERLRLQQSVSAKYLVFFRQY